MTARLTCEGLVFRWPGGFAAGPLTLDLGPGVHHLRGRNGAGKTTLLRCLCGGLRGSVGKLSIASRSGPAGGLDPRTDPAGRARVALLTAEPELPPWLTVDEAWQTLAAIRARPTWDGTALREAFGLPGTLPLGHCSAGQRRLAELLATATGDPDVLLLDEPFANLDPVSTARVAAAVDGWRADRVVLITSHQAPPVALDGVAEIGAVDAAGAGRPEVAT